MQAKRKLLPILLVLIAAAVIVTACGGGAAGQEKTWFNLPAAPLDVNPDGTVSLYGLGLPVGAIVPATLVQQLQSADVQQLQVRIGANGINLFTNGQELPFISWTSESAKNLGSALNAAGITTMDMNQLRTVGLGLNLKIPPAQGKPVLDVPRWRGETAPPAAAAATGQPISLGISFDAEGNPSALGLSPEALAAIAGGALPKLDPGTLQMLSAMGMNKLQISTTPTAITIVANDSQPFPSLAYDAASLQRLVDLLKPILQSTPDTLATLEQVAAILPNQNLNLTVGFNGTPVETKLSDLPVGISDSGNITFGGMPIPGAAIPAATLDQLKSAGIQSVGIAATDGGILLAANGQTLPKITYTDQGLNTLANLAGAAAGVSPQMITGGLQAVTSAGLSTSIALPGGQAAPAPTEPTFAAPDLGDVPTPTLRVAATVKDGQITSIGGLSAEQLAALGVALPTLPANVTDALKGLGAKQIDIVTEPNKLRVTADGNDVLGMEYDQASLKSAWDLAKPQLATGALADPGLQKLIEEQFLPLLPGTDLKIAITLE
ncbi:MAG: hypothetical protein U0X20_14845 [Caldilineaceae bacterium]